MCSPVHEWSWSKCNSQVARSPPPVATTQLPTLAVSEPSQHANLARVKRPTCLGSASARPWLAMVMVTAMVMPG
mgnify:CR=1 FL=1